MAPTDGTEVPLPQPSWTTKYAASLAERVVRIFVLAFAGVYLGALAAGNTSALSDTSFAQKALIAGIMAGLNFLLGLIAKSVGNNGTPAVLPAQYDPATRTWTASLNEAREGRTGDRFVDPVTGRVDKGDDFLR